MRLADYRLYNELHGRVIGVDLFGQKSVQQESNPGFRFSTSYPYIIVSPAFERGTRRRSGWRHCPTNRKVAGSIPDGVGVFH
jgi:hypothetical protein